MRDECLQKQTPPEGLDVGASRDSGLYLRNLKRGHVRLRFQGDDPTSPAYGHKLSSEFWKDEKKQVGKLSVNEKNCVGGDVCSIAIQKCSERYHHIAEIDLSAVNAAKISESRFIAVYSPTDDLPVNKCHFEILSEDSTVTGMQVLQCLLDDPFPERNNLPKNEVDKRTALDAFESFSAIIKIRCSVYPREVPKTE